MYSGFLISEIAYVFSSEIPFGSFLLTFYVLLYSCLTSLPSQVPVAFAVRDCRSLPPWLH